MSAKHGYCLGCSRHTRLRDDFCQRCEIKLTPEIRVVHRRLAGMGQELARTLNKLEANAIQAVKWGQMRGQLLDLRLDAGVAEEARKRIDGNVRAIYAERLPLAGRVARQHAAIVALRRKHAIPRRP